MKIHEIILNNYRAFLNEPGEELSKYVINLSRGENLLIYGENGSGKSSLFKALKDFFNSASNRGLSFQRNIFSDQFDLKHDPFVTVTFSSNLGSFTHTYSSDLSKINTNVEFIKDAHRSRSFMSYRELMKIHFIEKRQINLFDFLFSEHGLLAANPNPSGSVPETRIPLGQLCSRVYVTPDDPVLLSDFNSGIKIELKGLTVYLNKLLAYFDSNVFVEFVFDEITTEDAKRQQCHVGLEVTYCKRRIREHHLFLNEARLTAIAISLYLAAHLSVPKGAFEILFLDDVFTGLDTSNRLPLLRILDAEKIGDQEGDTFLNHQIFLTTYDRYWFDLAKQHLGKKWKSMELFVGDGPDSSVRPVLIQSSDDYYSKARLYFNIKDYPACANYQRKECERLIKLFLPDNLKYSKDEKGNIIPVDSLGTLVDNLKKYFLEIGLDFKDFRDFKNYTKVVMNPLSHDDLSSPAYRMELESVFSLIESLRKLKTTIKIKAGKKLKLKKEHSKTKVIHEYEFELRSNVRLVEYGELQKVTPIILLPLRIKIHDTDLTVKRLSFEDSAEKVWGMICHSLEIDSKENSFLDNFFIQDQDAQKLLRQFIGG